MRGILFKVIRITLAFLAVVLLWLNAKLYLPPVAEEDRGKVPRTAEAHLSWLRGELDDGSGEEMQRLFPEGYFFSYGLYGLAWVEIGLRSEEHVDEAIREARWALEKIESVAGRAPFPANLPPGHGMFFSGWRNHLLAGIVLLGKKDLEIARLRNWCDELAIALEAASTWPWLASYHSQVWPCDTPPGIHAMCVFDKVTGEGRYTDFVKRWISAVSGKVDTEYGMLTHLAAPGSGQPVGLPRGTSQTIILRFLADIDPTFASGQYQRFQEHFLTSVWGLPSIREYPKGVDGKGDVDSGPLIAGTSASATVVGMGVAQIYGDHGFSKATSQLAEVAGFPFGFSKRRYLGGILPVGDAFVIHAMTARPWIQEESRFEVEPTSVPLFWRWGIHSVSLVGAVVLLLLWRFVDPGKGTKRLNILLPR